MRRTVSVTVKEAATISSPRKDEIGRETTKLHAYTCREMPADKWMCRPATNLEMAAVMLIWKEAWPYLSKPSRVKPPNGWQYCIYQK